jgi:hypothetical protein
MSIKILKSSGNSGELTELLSGRTDLSKYYSGCSEIVNGQCLPQGGIIKRSGTKFIAKTKIFKAWRTDTLYSIGCVVIGTVASIDSYYYCNVEHTSGIGASTTLADDITAQPTYWTLVEARPIDYTTIGSKVKLFGFEFSTTDVHTLEFGTRYMRVFKNGARVLESEKTINEVSLNIGGIDTYTKLCSNFNGIDEAVAYTDPVSGAATFGGAAQLDTAQKKFGTASLKLLAASNDYVTYPADANWNFGTGTFTIEARIRLKTTGIVNSIITIAKDADNYCRLLIYPDGSIHFNNSATTVNADYYTGALGWDVDTWYHIAVVRNGANVYIFIDGVLQEPTAATAIDAGTSLGLSDGLLYIGRSFASYFDGHIDEVRISKGSARWTASFTPPVSAYTTATDGKININSTAHGYVTGNTIIPSELTVNTQLNSKEYLITKVDANNYTLDDTDSTDFIANDFIGNTERVYEVLTPYDSTDVFQIHKTQSADVMYIAHEDFAPRTLSRLGDANWTMAETVFTNGPFLSENTDATQIITFKDDVLPTLKYSLAGATGTLVASGTGNTPFNQYHVGSLWLLKHSRKDATLTTPYNSTHDAPTTIDANCTRIKGDFSFDVKTFGTDTTYTAKIWRKEGNGEWTEYRTFQSASAYSSTEKFDDVYYCWTRSAVSAITGNLTAKEQVNRGVVKITGFTSSTEVSCTVMTAVYNEDVGAASYDSATSMWAEGAWNEYRGYPRTVSFYEDRLYWAGTTNNPQTIWGSATGEYLSHLTGNTDSDALVLPLNANDVSQIQWIAARKTMIVGTASTEFVVSATNPDDPMTAIDKKASPQSYIGSNSLQPVILNNGLFYFQRQGKKLNVMTFAYEIDSYKSDNATLFANHILEDSSPTTMAVQLTPDPCLWLTRSDGTLCCFVYEPGEEVFAAWSRCVTGSNLTTPVGYYESCAVVHGTDEDELWLSIKRIIGDVAYRYIELSAPRYISQADEAMMLDSAVVVESPYVAQTIVLASDTIRYGSGVYGSSRYGGR